MNFIQKIRHIVKNVKISRQTIAKDKYRLNCVFFLKAKFDLKNEIDENFSNSAKNAANGSYDLLNTKFRVVLSKGAYFKCNIKIGF